MRRSPLFLMPVVSLAGSAWTAPPAHAELDPVCSGTPTNHATYACVVHVHPEEVLPTFTVGVVGELPEVCLLNACPGPHPIEVPGVIPSEDTVLVLWWNGLCYDVHADGRLTTEPGPLDAENRPVCSEE